MRFCPEYIWNLNSDRKEQIMHPDLSVSISYLICWGCRWSLLSVLRLCKSWLSRISDPHLAISHFDLQNARTLDSSIPEILSIDINASFYDYSDYVTWKLSAPIHFGDRFVCSCRDFLLLDYNRSSFIFNPSTGLHKFVDWSPISNNMGGYGFGYDPSTDDYLLVQASTNKNPTTST